MLNQRYFRESPYFNNVKMSAVTPDEIADTMVALANTDGGWLTDMSHDSQTVIVSLARQCSPAIDVEIRTFPDEVIALIPRSKQIHATPDQRVLVWSKNGNVELNGKQIRQLAQIRSVGDYENEVVPGASLDDLDTDLTSHLCNLLEIEELRTSSTLDSQGHPTVAGMLLCGIAPQRWLPQSAVMMQRFGGKSSSHPTNPIQQQNIQGNLWTILETLRQWVHGNTTWATNNIALPTLYPPSIIFEALHNAVIHRDYRLKESIEINIYDDGLHIVSPGALPNFIHVDHLENYRFHRNPSIAYLLSIWEHEQPMRMDIGQLKAQVAADHQITLAFTTARNHITLSIHPKDTALIENMQSSPMPAINWRQERAIRYIQECGSLTYHEFHALCPNIEQQILFSDLVDLVEKKLVVKAGTKNVFFYLQHQ